VVCWPRIRPIPRVVDVWSVRAGVLARQYERFFVLLSPDDHIRARRYLFEMDSRHFILRRGMLRTILGGYLALGPAAVEFCGGSIGNLGLLGVGPLRFSLARSGDLFLYAYSWKREVDVERIRPLNDLHDLATAFFAPSETAAWFKLAAPRRLAAFFQCWTSKEAVLKGTGEGLGRAPETSEVVIDPTQPLGLTRVNGSWDAPRRWSKRRLTMPGRAGALAVEGADPYLIRHRWLQLGSETAPEPPSSLAADHGR
jgi:4'-phosphopantetheinyl transferase